MVVERRAIVFRSPRAWRVRLVQLSIWLSAAGLAGFTYISWNLHVADRTLLLLTTVALFVAAVAFEVYLRRYVICISRSGDRIQLTTLTTFHQRTLEAPTGVLDRASIEFFDTEPGQYSSWRLLRVDGRPIPFVLDTTEISSAGDR